MKNSLFSRFFHPAANKLPAGPAATSEKPARQPLLAMINRARGLASQVLPQTPLSPEIAAKLSELNAARQAIAVADQKLAVNRAEILQIRGECAAFKERLSQLNARRENVTSTVASLGFSVAPAGDTDASLIEAFRKETDPTIRGELFAKWKAERDLAASANA